jgi:hypothetical protein
LKFQDPQFQLVMLDATGFFIPQYKYSLAQGRTLLVATTQILADVQVSFDGSVRVCSSESMLYQFDNVDSWVEVPNSPEDVSAFFLALDDESLIVITTMSNSVCVPSLDLQVAISGTIHWACLTVDRLSLLVCATNVQGNVITRTIVVLDVTTLTQTAIFYFTFPFNIFEFYSAVCSADLLTIYVQKRQYQGAFFVTMTRTQFGNSYDYSLDTTSPTSRFFKNMAWVQGTDLRFVDDTITPIVVPAMSWTSAFAMTKEGNAMTFSLSNPYQFYLFDKQTQTFTLQTYALVLGYYVLDDYNTVVDGAANDYRFWYYGMLTAALSKPPTIGQLAVSRHSRGRLVLTSVTEATAIEFSHATVQYQTSNDYLILTTSSTIQLFENANLVALNDQDPDFFFQTNTRDESSDKTSFQTWKNTTTTLVTRNGLYILFLDSVANRVKIVYNVFNSAQLANWCKPNKEYRARALQAQSDFCFGNLKTGVGLFADSRCSCIGGSRLVKELFPNAFENEEAPTTTTAESLQGKLASSFPCLITACGESFLEGPEVTNAYLFAAEQCRQDVVLCSSVIATNGAINFDNFSLQQNCGTRDGECNTNAECPMGFLCFNGMCVQQCTLNSVCQEALQDPLARCDLARGICVFSNSNIVNKSISATLQTRAKIVSIVCGTLAVIVLVILICLYANSNSKKKQKSSTLKK